MRVFFFRHFVCSEGLLGGSQTTQNNALSAEKCKKGLSRSLNVWSSVAEFYDKMKHPNKYVGILLSLWIFLMISGCGKSKPHSRVFIKEAGYSIIPPTGWEEGRKAPPDIQKLNDKVGRRYIRSSQKGYCRSGL